MATVKNYTRVIATGTIGPPGPPGETGPQGEIGPDGPDGTTGIVESQYLDWSARVDGAASSTSETTLLTEYATLYDVNGDVLESFTDSDPTEDGLAIGEDFILQRVGESYDQLLFRTAGLYYMTVRGNQTANQYMHASVSSVLGYKWDWNEYYPEELSDAVEPSGAFSFPIFTSDLAKHDDDLWTPGFSADSGSVLNLSAFQNSGGPEDLWFETYIYRVL